MTGRQRTTDHDLLTELRGNQEEMRGDIKYMREKIEYLYQVDPPGPLFKLSSHLEAHEKFKQQQADEFQKKIQKTNIRIGIVGALMVLIAVVVDRVLSFLGVR